MLDVTTRLAQAAELLHVLLVHDLVELLLGDPEFLEQRRDREEGAEERVALHAQLQVGAVGGFPRNLEPGQHEHADLLLDDLLAGPQRQPLPRLLALFLGFPDETAALLHAVERIVVGERLRIAAQHDVDVAQVAVHPDALRRGDHEVGGRRAFLFRSVFRIRPDVDDFLGIAEFVDDLVALVEQIVQVADDRAQVLAGRDRAPAADGVEADRDGAFGQQRRRLVGLHLVGVIDAEHDERHAVRRALAVLALALADRELVRADRVLRAEIARAQAVNAARRAAASGRP